jgi:hypothetical protein
MLINMQENATLGKHKVIIYEGQKFGILSVGPLVRWAREHPLFDLTPSSYIIHGRLRECYCDCGEMKLYSECALQTNSIKSCGCLKRKRNMESAEEKLKREEKKARKREINHRIRQTQAKLKVYQQLPVPLRDQPKYVQEMDLLAAELRKLFSMKAYANRKQV